MRKKGLSVALAALMTASFCFAGCGDEASESRSGGGSTGGKEACPDRSRRTESREGGE